jgi:hypothetical protein
MTPKEKAKEIFEKIYSILLNDFHFYITEEKNTKLQKELCLTLVNQIQYSLIETEREYWVSVKEHIQDLDT